MYFYRKFYRVFGACPMTPESIEKPLVSYIDTSTRRNRTGKNICICQCRHCTNPKLNENSHNIISRAIWQQNNLFYKDFLWQLHSYYTLKRIAKLTMQHNCIKSPIYICYAYVNWKKITPSVRMSESYNSNLYRWH